MTTLTALDEGLHWAVRDSLIRYVTVIAHGTYTVEGGASEREGGAFVFPLRRAVREGADWRLSFGGSVRLVAHNGLMDILIKDPEVVIGPDRGVLATHVEDEPDGLLAVVAVDAALPSAGEDGLEWRNVPTRLAPAAVGMFGTVYPADTEMSAISIRLRPGRP